MSVTYSCQLPLGKGFARTAGVQVDALKSKGLLKELYSEDKLWDPGQVNLGGLKDTLFDGIVASHLEPCAIFHGWNNAMLLSMRTAKTMGAKTIVERQSAHISVQKTLVGGVDPYAEMRMVKEYDAADIILVPSRLVEQSFLAAQPELKPKLRRIPLGVDLDKFKRISQFKHTFRALFVASNFDRKGGLYLMKAWQMARAVSPAVKKGALWIVGDVPPGDLGAGVNPVGSLAEQEYVRTMMDCDILLLPSLEDGFGLVVLEAMSAGKPVIISDQVGAKDCMADEREGYIVPAGDAAKLARAIVSLADSDQRRIDMGEQAHRSATHFTWQRYSDMYLELIKETLA